LSQQKAYGPAQLASHAGDEIPCLPWDSFPILSIPSTKERRHPAIVLNSLGKLKCKSKLNLVNPAFMMY
jgi:hypothetical protein